MYVYIPVLMRVVSPRMRVRLIVSAIPPPLSLYI